MQDPDHRGIDPLEGVETQFGLAVLVLQQPDQLAGCALGSEGRADQPCRLRNLGVVARRCGGGLVARGGSQQVEDKTEPVPGLHQPHLVLAIGIERCEAEFGAIGGRQIDARLATAVADSQLAADVRRRQLDQQGAEHAGRLFAVAVGQEESARVVDQQLVQLGPNGRVLATQSARRIGEHPAQ